MTDTVKGISRRVVVVRSPDPKVFDEAIFIVKEDAIHEGITNEEILRQAQGIAENYCRTHGGERIMSRLSPMLFAAGGAAVTAIIWCITLLIW